MAEIPLTLVQRRVPRGGDYSPARGVGLPRMGEPPGGLAEAISHGGASVSRTLLGMSEQHVRARQASDTIAVQDATAQYTDGLLDWQQNLAADQSIPPLELRTRLEAKRNELLNTYSARLPARLRPQFLAQARQASLQPLYTLDQVGVQRLGEQATRTFEHRAQQIERQRLQSTSPVEHKALDDQFDQLVNDYVFQGLTAPQQGPILKQQYRDKVAVTQMEQQIRQDPKGMAEQLELGPQANPTLPPDKIPAFLDQARSLQQQQLQWYDAAQRRADQAVDRAQEANTGSLWAEFVKLDPTPANSEKLRNLLARAEQDFKDGKISAQQYQEMSGRGRAMLDRSLQPGAERDNVALERELTVALARANTPDAIKAVQARLLERASELRPETIQRLNTAIEQRQRADHYSNTKEYRDGVEIILRAAVVPEIGGAAQGLLKEETQRKLSLALDAYEEQMSQVATQDVGQMKAQARALAYRLRDLYLPLEAETPGIPAKVQEAPTEEALKQELQRLEQEGVPLRQRDSYRKWWQQRQEQKRKDAEEHQKAPPATPRKRSGG